MASYKVDDPRKQIKLEVVVVSPGDAKSLCFIDDNLILESPENFGGNIPSAKIGVNKDLESKSLKV